MKEKCEIENCFSDAKIAANTIDDFKKICNHHEEDEKFDLSAHLYCLQHFYEHGRQMKNEGL